MCVKIVANELIPVDSVEHIYKGASLWGSSLEMKPPEKYCIL
jgi:hypothetical protein